MPTIPPAAFAAMGSVAGGLLQGIMAQHMAREKAKADAIAAAKQARLEAIRNQQEVYRQSGQSERSALANMANMFRSSYV